MCIPSPPGALRQPLTMTHSLSCAASVPLCLQRRGASMQCFVKQTGQVGAALRCAMTCCAVRSYSAWSRWAWKAWPTIEYIYLTQLSARISLWAWPLYIMLTLLLWHSAWWALAESKVSPLSMLGWGTPYSEHAADWFGVVWAPACVPLLEFLSEHQCQLIVQPAGRACLYMPVHTHTDHECICTHTEHKMRAHPVQTCSAPTNTCEACQAKVARPRMPMKRWVASRCVAHLFLACMHNIFV